jgi:hypothetical protein
VLDRDGLVDRLLVVLRELSDVEVLPATELDGWARTEPSTAFQSCDATAPARPDAVIASPGIDPAVAALAASLCGSRALPLAVHDIQLMARAGARSALLLLNPKATPAGFATSAVQALDRAGIGWGLLQAEDQIDARFVLLKALLVGHVPASGGIGFMSTAYALSAGEGAPACLRPSGSAGGRDFFEAGRDVLFLSGHANALDASIGDDLILCARQGRRGAAADLLPCFSDGICFRQPAVGAQRDLLDPRRAGGRVLVMSGCNLVSLGQAWFSASGTLVQQALDGPAIAIIASSAASVVSLELDLLCLGLIAEGLPLGEVVASLNRVRRDLMRHSTGLPPDIGPLVLMGNPLLRVGGLQMEAVAGRVVEAPARGSIRIAVRPPQHDRETGVLLRLELPTAPHRYVEVEDEEEVFWCRGMQHQAGGRSFLFLWLAGVGVDSVHLRLSSTDPWSAVRRTVELFWAELFFWTQFLDCYLEEIRAIGAEAEPLRSAAAELPGLARRLAGISARMHSPPGALTSRRAMFRLASAGWREFAPWSDTLLLSAVEAIIRTGRVHSYGSSPFYRLAEETVDGPGAVCLCAGGVMTGQVFRGPDGRSRRIEYQCALCGATTDEDGRGLVRMVRCPAATSIDQGLSAECECAAPEDSHGPVHAILVLEPWVSGRRTVSRIHRDVLAPGETTRFTLELELPADLSEGSYTISVVAVVNGALSILRRMVQISGALPQTSSGSLGQPLPQSRA